MMLSIAAKFITGCMVGIEFFSGEDVEDPNLKMGVVVDLLIVRIELGFYKDLPEGYV